MQRFSNVKLGKGTGRPSFAEVVSSAATVSGNRVAAKIDGDWPLPVRCDVEKTQLRGMEMGAVRQVRDCSVLEEQAVGPSGMDHSVDDHFRSRGCVCRPAGVSRDSGVEGDVSLQGDGVFGVFEKVFEILGRFSKALVWACGFSKKLGSKSLFGFKRRVGFVAGQVLKRVKSVFKGFRAGAKVIKPNAKLDAVSGHKLSSVSGAILGRRSGPGCLQRSTEVHGSALRPDMTSAADPGVDLGLSHSGAGSRDRQLVPVVESVNQATVLPPLSTPVLRPPVLLSDLPSGVRSSMVSSFSGSGLIHRQAVVLPSAGSVLVRSGVEEFQFGEPGASSSGAGHASVGVASGAPSGSLLRHAVVHSDAPALVRSFGGVPLFGKFVGPPGVSASIPPFQWVLFPQWPRPFSFVEVGESSKGIDPKESVVVYPRVVKDSRSCFRTMGVSFVGSDQKGFLDFLTLIEDERYDSDSSPKKVKEIKRKKGKREVKNLECSINFDARGVGSSWVRGKKLGV
jgi:hypothetical protein